MSGSAGLAAAKRRRAGPSAVTNELPKRPSNLPQQKVQHVQQQMGQVPLNISNTHPLVILAQHEQHLSRLQMDVEDIRLNQERHPTSVQQVDEQSIQYFKTKYEAMSQELDEMKKLLIRIQTFSMESNLEILKVKKALKNDPRMKEEEDTGIENLSLNETN